MKLIRMAATALSVTALSACVTHVKAPPTPALLSDPAIISAKTKVVRDEYKKVTQYVGSNASQYNKQFLRAWKHDDGQETTYQIYLTSFYGSAWRFYNEAYDSNGVKLDFISIDRQVDSCSGARGCYYEETVGLNVSREYLDKNRDSGIHYKVSGKTGEFTGFLPGAYVAGFLLSVDRQ